MFRTRSDFWWLMLVLGFIAALWALSDSPCMDWPGGQSCDLKLEFLKPL